MKKSLRSLILFFAGAISLTGCVKGGNKGGGLSAEEGKGTIEIVVAKLGNGTDWLKALCDAYNKKTGVGFEIHELVGQAGIEAIQTEMESLASSTDLFVTRPKNYFKMVYSGAVNVRGETYPCALADLTDVYTTPLEGENGATVLSKMDSKYSNYFNIDGRYYGLPWGSDIMGVVRNLNVWNKLGLKDEDVPNTTDEMFALCDKVKSKGTAPFIYSLSDEYYSTIVPIWFAQYEGSASMANWFNGRDPSGQETYNIYSYDGMVKSLEILQTLLDSKKGYQHESSKTLPFTSMQGYFLRDQALFCVNGSWLETEMGSNYKGSNIDYIRTPIVSALSEKMSYYDASNPVENDKKLSALVDYVDGRSSSLPEGTTTEDAAIVKDARESASYIRGGHDHNMLVPSYSDQIENVKDFLRFVYSDEGLNIYYKVMEGGTLPAKPTNGYTTEGVSVSQFRENINTIMGEGHVCHYGSGIKAKVFCLGGVNRYYVNGTGNMVHEILEGKTPEKIIATNQAYIKQNWNSIRSQYVK